ncbi:MAG: succinate dehydrogenase assembly factor 2 [Burkholderiaceae bacterium]
MTAVESAEHQEDPVNRRRLRWRARRGLLENDIILTRFLDLHETELTDKQIVGLNQLLDLTDNDLMDLLLGRREPDAEIRSNELDSVLRQIRNC